MIKCVCVCGARPNFMKIAPIMDSMHGDRRFEVTLVHTGQHYDERMSHLFFEELGIPRPDINLEVGSCSHAVQTARVMERFEPVCLEKRPDWVIVVGDVNSTVACALVASKLGIRIAHVEAGLRSFDRSMPEEVNRVVTDAISDLLLVTEQSGVENLRSEGADERRIKLVGNVMIDTLLRHRDRANSSAICDTLGVQARRYAVVTLHRPSNVDDPAVFGGILTALERIAMDMPIVFPIHPRSRANLDRLGLSDRIRGIARLQLVDPLGYLDFLKLMGDASVVLTDSGGIQEETTILRVPCLTLRHNTERPATISHGTNRLTGPEPNAILQAYGETRTARTDVDCAPPLWDGQAAERIVDCLAQASREAPRTDWRPVPEPQPPLRRSDRVARVPVQSGQ